MTSQLQELKPIQLRWGDGQVVVTPEDQDRFVREAKWAVAACQGLLQLETFVKKLQEELLTAVHKWCERNAGRVLACYIPFASPQVIQVFVIGNGAALDFQLCELTSELESSLEQEGWSTDIVQLPNSSPEMLLSFFDPSRSIQVYGNTSGTQVEGGPQLQISGANS